MTFTITVIIKSNILFVLGYLECSLIINPQSQISSKLKLHDPPSASPQHVNESNDNKEKNHNTENKVGEGSWI